MAVEVTRATMDNGEPEPFLLVSQSVPVICEKCGSEVPSPGRIAIRTDGEARYYCDCVTEEEMQVIIEEWNSYAALLIMPEENPQ